MSGICICDALGTHHGPHASSSTARVGLVEVCASGKSANKSWQTTDIPSILAAASLVAQRGLMSAPREFLSAVLARLARR